MPVYIVELKDDPQSTDRNFLQAEVGKIRGAIEAFNESAKDDRITIKSSLWLSPSVTVEASPEAVRKLAEATGYKITKPPRPTRA